MKRIALLAQNAHEAESALLIARQLERAGWGTAEFVSLDRFFQQGAERVFADTGIHVRLVEPRRPLPAPFYLLPRFRRLAVVIMNQGQLSRLAARYDALVAGSDGALERVLINSMRGRDRSAYLVIGGLHFAHPEPWLKAVVRRLAARLRLNHLFFSELGQGMCRRVFAPGENSRAQLRSLGVPAERIAVTGSPRFASMVLPGLDPRREILLRLGRPGPVRLLYLMQAWEWHGQMDESRAEAEQLRQIMEAVRSRADELELAVRLHPRSSEAEKSRVTSLPAIRILSAEQPIRSDLRSADVVLGVASTGLLEAIALGRLALFVDLCGIGGNLDLDLFAEHGMWVVRNSADLELALTMIQSPGRDLEARAEEEVAALWHFIAPSSPEAAERIVSLLGADLGI